MAAVCVTFDASDNGPLPQVRALPNPPSIMYVGLRWKGSYFAQNTNGSLAPVWRGESWPRKCDGVYAQLAVTRQYGVAHTSPWDGLLSADPPVSDTWIDQEYAKKGDNAHSACDECPQCPIPFKAHQLPRSLPRPVTAYGYAVARRFFVESIASITAAWTDDISTNGIPRPTMLEPPLLFVTAAQLHTVLTASPLVIDLHAAAVRALHDVDESKGYASSADQAAALATPARWVPRVVNSSSWRGAFVRFF